MGWKVPTFSDIKNDFERSDLGKGAGALTDKFKYPIKTAEQLARGDVEGAFNTGLSGFMGSNPVSQVLNSSSSAETLFETKEANNLSFGLTGDAVKATDAYNQWQDTGKLTDQQLKDILIYNAKGAALAYGASYGYEAGWIDKAWAWVSGNPLDAAVAAKLASQGKYADAIATISPELGEYLPQPVQDRPIGFEPSTGIGAAIDNFSIEAIDTKTKWALIAALFFVVALIFKKTRG